MFAVEHNEPGLIIQSHNPAVSPGATLTPGNNAYGAYVQVLGSASAFSITDEGYELWININTVNASAAAKDCLVTIGIDLAGGTSYTDWILDLSGSCASVYASTAACLGGITYIFPIRVPAGASLAAKATVNNATVGTVNVQMRVKCRPTRPDLIRVGSYVKTFGSTPLSSNGTGVTPGNSAEGAFVQLGTVPAGEHLWYWQLGWCINNATITANNSFADLSIGDGSNKRAVIVDMPVYTNTSEAIGFENPWNAYAQANAGDGIYARAFNVGAAVTGHSAIAYGVGGAA